MPGIAVARYRDGGDTLITGDNGYTRVQTYLVGGAVRDRLLGRPVRERDWVITGATPQQVLSLGFRQKDPAFPVFAHPRTGEEYALARRERKRGPGHKGFVFEFGPDVTLADDLSRRDLTINAMAQDERDTLHDPHGGQTDLTARRLRHVTAAFREDPLRVLRLARFAAELGCYGFEVAADTAELVTHMSRDDDLLTLSSGRVWRETERALASPAPQLFFRCLREFGALPRLMPWLVSSTDPGAQTAIDALTRAAALDDDITIRLAALLTGAAHCSGADGLPGPDWPLPRAGRELAALCMEHPLPPQRLDADTVTDWLLAMDAWRRGERFAQALQVWRAVTPTHTDTLQLLRSARESSARVPGPPEGTDPRRALRDARRAMVRAVLVGSGGPE
jgi:tRNA nucleotidyltransferase (CCA-adding enzyme)